MGVQVYEIVRPAHANVALSIMQQIPNLNINDLQKLDEKILNTSSSGPLVNATNQGSAGNKSNKIDKNKKDLFKKITAQLIGRNVLAQLFRNPAVINDLHWHPQNNNIKHKTTNILDTSADPGMHQLFRDVPR